jgi:DNA-binding transcriptional LysR family regulator
MDWDDLRFALAIIRHGRLSAAARHLSVTQTTVARRLATLERGAGVRLVHRGPEGYVLTELGEAIRARVERIEAEVLAIERMLHGQDTTLDRPVRMHSCDLLSMLLLPPLATRLAARHPDICIEALTGAPEPDLIRHEADVMIRMRGFERPSVVVRRVGALRFGLYAAQAYLERHGVPDFRDRCAGHRLIAPMEQNQAPPQAAWLSAVAAEAQTTLRADNVTALLRAAAAGAGLALLPCTEAETVRGLRRLEPPVPVPDAEIWLAVHEDNRRVPRIRAVLDSIADMLARNGEEPKPAGVLAVGHHG